MKYAAGLLYYGLGSIAEGAGETDVAKAAYGEAAGRMGQLQVDKTTIRYRALTDMCYDKYAAWEPSMPPAEQ